MADLDRVGRSAVLDADQYAFFPVPVAAGAVFGEAFQAVG